MKGVKVVRVLPPDEGGVDRISMVMDLDECGRVYDFNVPTVPELHAGPLCVYQNQWEAFKEVLGCLWFEREQFWAVDLTLLDDLEIWPCDFEPAAGSARVWARLRTFARMSCSLGLLLEGTCLAESVTLRKEDV